jgi:hypothetical protein
MMLRNSNCKVITFLPEDRPDILRTLHATQYNHINYDTISWFDFDCISVLQDGDNIVGFSSIWHREEHYKKGEVRILNRYWEDDSLRRGGRELARSHILAMVSDQLKYAKDLGYTKAFISREKNPRVFKELINKIAIGTNTEWHIHDKRVPVCEGHGCLQFKGYTKL